jgi:diacylglycerol O-acyltransferase
VSHSLVDGVGLCLALTEAALGRDSSIDWPPPASRGRWQALRQDIVQTARDVPTMIRAVTTVLRTARKAGTGGGSAQPSRSATVEVIDDDEGSIAPVPMATMFVDAAQWEARAQELGGTNNSLLVGVAARLAKRVGRLTADGRVVVGLPVNQRVEGDTRANARTNVTVTVDPDLATTDLRDIRAAVKQALIHLQEHPAETHAIDPLIPVLPKRLLRAGSRTDGSSGVGSSNLGVVDDAAGRADGTDADRFSIGVLPHMGITQEMLHRFDGVQTFLSGIAQGRVFITAASSQPGHTGSSEDLRKDLSHALSDFSLTGASF